MKKLFDIITPLMTSGAGVLDSENDAVQEALSLLFKVEAGVEYTNEEPEMPEEDFGYQEPYEPVDVAPTEDIIDNLTDIYG